MLSDSRVHIKNYEKEQVVHFQNEVCNSMGIILDGQVSIQKIEENGNLLVINVFENREVFGANLLFSSRCYYPMTVVATKKSIIMHVNKKMIIQLCQTDMKFLTCFLNIISDRTIILSDKINEISLKTIRQQIMDFLKYEKELQKSNTIRLHISKKSLAERLGIQRSSLSRELNKMRADGILEFDSKTITLLKS